MDTNTSPAWQRHASAVLSGFFGDWLEARRSPLAMPMTFFLGYEPVNPGSPSVERPGSTLCLSIHGLMELESVWAIPGRDGADYGSLLAAENSDITPLTLRYNSGRSICRNGETLADMLDTLVRHWPVTVERIILIGHSMGGLLIRSASHFAQLHGHRWVEQLRDCVYIASPHDGSWLARGAKAAADRMNKAPRDYFRVLGEVIDLRSEGIRNLSRGDVLSSKDSEPPLLPGVRHYVVCGLLARSRQHPVNALFGDALVQEPSAFGRERKGWTLAGEASFPGVDHIRLAHHPDVAAQLRKWLL